MASISLFEISIAILCFIIFHYFLNKKPHKSFPRNWPVIGMLPGLYMELNRIYDFLVELMENSNLTFQFKGPWLTGMDMLVTVDPANIHYILSSNFSNYHKGTEFKEVFDVFKDVIFNADSELWKNMRKAAQATVHHQDFQRFSMSTTKRTLKNGLVPLFNRFAEERTVMDLQDVFNRFMFDTTMILITGFDLKTMEMLKNEFAEALADAEDVILSRHFKPRFLWKLQNWLGMGLEKKINKAEATFDRVCSQYISDKRQELMTSVNGEAEDLLTSYMKLDPTKYEILNPNDNKFLKDIILSYIIAGRDTIASALTWFFWLLSENPQVVTKIRQEINTNLTRTRSLMDLDKLVYLHGALYEAMRLYPPVPFERNSNIKPDVLPSGHRVKENTKIIIALYALGRMRAVWGEDACEFKPERWVSKSGDNGGLRHEPSFKFLSFNAGPRSCIGKHLAVILMKTAVVEILQNFEIDVVKGQKIEPAPGLFLNMRNGLRATVTKRSTA